MNILLDTQALIRWLDERVPRRLARLLTKPQTGIVVSIVTPWEIAMKRQLGFRPGLFTMTPNVRHCERMQFQPCRRPLPAARITLASIIVNGSRPEWPRSLAHEGPSSALRLSLLSGCAVAAMVLSADATAPALFRILLPLDNRDEGQHFGMRR